MSVWNIVYIHFYLIQMKTFRELFPEYTGGIKIFIEQ